MGPPKSYILLRFTYTPSIWGVPPCIQYMESPKWMISLGFVCGYNALTKQASGFFPVAHLWILQLSWPTHICCWFPACCVAKLLLFVFISLELSLRCAIRKKTNRMVWYGMMLSPHVHLFFSFSKSSHRFRGQQTWNGTGWPEPWGDHLQPRSNLAWGLPRAFRGVTLGNCKGWLMQQLHY